jgi:hypothetical protein
LFYLKLFVINYDLVVYREDPYLSFPLIGESISKILGKKKLPKILLIPSPHEERDRVRSG